MNTLPAHGIMARSRTRTGGPERSRRAARAALVLVAWTASGTASARAADSSAQLDDAAVLPPSSDALEVQSVMTRVTSFDQYGHGYQSQAGPLLGPGSERATIFEPQLEITATQGPRLRHVVTVPIDVVTAASPDALDSGPRSADVVSSASRFVVSGTIDWTTMYRVDPALEATMRTGLHLEEPFRSWHGGLGGSRSFYDGDTVIAANVVELFDWFDRFDVTGHRFGRTQRSTTTASAGVTQILTPTTIVAVNYGVTLQRGEMGNTWNSVPVVGLGRAGEILPDERVRHALVARASQFLPWNGALRAYYRFYADDWGIVAHSIEAQLMQRLSPELYVGALYRFHTQTGATFFTTLALPNDDLRTADSDLAPLDSHTIGGRVVLDLPVDPGRTTMLHLEAGYERYFRTNDLHTDVVTCATGYRF